MNNSGYYSNFMNIFEQNNLTSLDEHSVDDDKIRLYTKEMKEKYLSFGRHILEH